jgi:hypothetical protein
MRDAGFDTSDPDARGEVKFGGDLRTLKADPKFTAAQVGCLKLRLPIPKELIEKEPLPSAQLAAARRAYAKCVRDNGDPSFHDPDADGRWPVDETPPSMTEQEGAAQFRATQFCQPVLDGKPPATPDPRITAQG